MIISIGAKKGQREQSVVENPVLSVGEPATMAT
jgi:hypothetical protein